MMYNVQVHTGYCIQTDVYISCLKWIETCVLFKTTQKPCESNGWINENAMPKQPKFYQEN